MTAIDGVPLGIVIALCILAAISGTLSGLILISVYKDLEDGD